MANDLESWANNYKPQATTPAAASDDLSTWASTYKPNEPTAPQPNPQPQEASLESWANQYKPPAPAPTSPYPPTRPGLPRIQQPYDKANPPMETNTIAGNVGYGIQRAGENIRNVPVELARGTAQTLMWPVRLGSYLGEKLFGQKETTTDQIEQWLAQPTTWEKINQEHASGRMEELADHFANGVIENLIPLGFLKNANKAVAAVTMAERIREALPVAAKLAAYNATVTPGTASDKAKAALTGFGYAALPAVTQGIPSRAIASVVNFLGYTGMKAATGEIGEAWKKAGEVAKTEGGSQLTRFIAEVAPSALADLMFSTDSRVFDSPKGQQVKAEVERQIPPEIKRQYENTTKVPLSSAKPTQSPFKDNTALAPEAAQTPSGVAKATGETISATQPSVEAQAPAAEPATARSTTTPPQGAGDAARLSQSNAGATSSEAKPELTTALQKPDGTIVKATDKGLPSDAPHDSIEKDAPESQRVFVDENTGKVLDRKQAEAATPEMESAKTDGRHSEDLRAANQRSTSTKNAVTDAERTARGADPILKEAAVSHPEEISKASKTIEANPNRPDEIIRKLNSEGTKSISVEDEAVLLMEKTRLMNERKAQADIITDPNATQEAKDSAQTRYDELNEKSEAMDNATRTSGTAWGRFGALRQRQMATDYSLEAIVRKTEVAKGRKLNPQEMVQANKDAAEIKGKEDVVHQKELEKTFDQILKAVLGDKKARTVRRVVPEAETTGKKLSDTVISALDKLEQEARNRLKGAGGRVHGGILPGADIVGNHAIILASKLAKGSIRFGVWAKEATAEFGEYIKPHLQAIWDRAKSMHLSMSEKGESPDIAVKSPMKSRSELLQRIADKGLNNKDLHELAMTHVAEGSRTRQDLMNRMSKDIKTVMPDATERQIGEALVNYGKTIIPDQSADAKTLRDLKTQERLTIAREDALSGKLPKKSGWQPDPMSDEARTLNQELQRIIKEKDLQPQPDAEKAMRTAEQTARRAKENRIADLKRQIEAGQRDPKAVARNFPEHAHMEAEIDRLQAQLDMVSPRKPPTTEQQIKTATQAAERSLAENERKIVEAELKAKKSEKPPLNSKELDAARKQRDASKAALDYYRKQEATYREKNQPDQAKQAQREVDRLNKQNDLLSQQIREGELWLEKPDAKPKLSTPEIEAAKARRDASKAELDYYRELATAHLTPEQKALAAYKNRVQTQIKQMEAKMKSGDYGKKTPREIQLDSEAMKAKSDLERVKQRLDRARRADRMERRPTWLKVLDKYVQFRKSAVISGLRTFAKVFTYTPVQLASKAAGEVAGAAWEKVPFVGEIFKGAPSEGGASAEKFAAALKTAFSKLAEDAKMTAGEGSDLEALYDPHYGRERGRTVVSAPGKLHAVEKAFTKRFGYEYSKAKREEYYKRTGKEMTPEELGKQAYADGKRDVLMEENWMADKLQALLASGKNNPETGKKYVAEQVASEFAKTQLPVIRIPLNHLKATLEYSFGLLTGLGRTAYHLANGIDKMTVGQKESIARQIKRGSVVAGLSAYAFLDGYKNQQNSSFGGLYLPGQKPKDDQLKPGEIRVGNQRIWAMFLAHPALLSMQFWNTVGRMAGAPPKKNKEEQDTPTKIAEGMAAATFSIMGTAPVVNEAQVVGKLADPNQNGHVFGSWLTGMLVPIAFQDIAKMMDLDTSTMTANKRYPSGIASSIAAGVPIARNYVSTNKKQPGWDYSEPQQEDQKGL